MGVVQLHAEVAPSARQEGERLLVGQLVALERAAGGVEVALHVEHRVRAEAGRQQVQRITHVLPGAEQAGALDVAFDVLVEDRARKQGAFGEVPLGDQVVVGRAEGLQLRVAEVDRVGAAVVEVLRRSAADARRQVQQRGAGHGLGRAEAQHQLVGQVPRQVHRRQHVLVVVGDLCADQVAVTGCGGGVGHAEERLAVLGIVGRVAGRARRPAGSGDLGVDHAHAHVATERPRHQVRVEIQLQVAAQAALVDLEVVVRRAEVADAGQAVVAAARAAVAVAVDVQQLRDLVEVGHQPARRRPRQVGAEAVQRGAQVAHGHPGRQRLGQAAVADVPVFLRAHVVALVGQAAAQGEGRVEVELQVHLGGVERVIHVLRIEPDFADVAAARGPVAVDRHGAGACPIFCV